MKTKLGLFFVLAALVAGTASGFAQTTTDVAAAKAVATADEMEQLVAPIALYPDVLVALILPAAIESADVVLAARFLERGGAEAQIDGQPWDDSVKGLARYPDVVKWMDENLSWTRQLGDAYLDKPEEVMAAIQRVRARAKAQGLLVSTAEQEVVAEGEYIRIVPAQPNVVYVPRYDPELIFVEHRVIYYRPDPWITFGVGFGVGWWLGYDCDWGRRVIVVNPSYRHHWRHHHDWRHHRFVHNHRFHHDWKPWAPSHRRHLHQRNHHNHFNRPGREIARPTPHHGAPRHDWNRPGERRDFRPHVSRDGQRQHFGRDGQQRREIGRSPAASTWSAGPRGQGIQQAQTGAAPQVGQRNEERREWRRDRERDGNRGPEQRREFAPNAPRVVGTPPAGTLRQRQPASEPVPRPQLNQRPDIRQRPEMAQRREMNQRQPMQQPRTERVQAPRPVTPQVAAAPAPRPVPAPERRASVSSDAGRPSTPRISAPSSDGRSASGAVRGGGGGGPRGGDGGRNGGRGGRGER